MSLTETQRKARRKGIGGSDAGSIMGANSYKSAYTLFQEKIGMVSDEIPSNEAMYWGNSLEKNILDRFYEEMPQLVRQSAQYVNVKLAVNLPEYILGNTDSWFVGKMDSNHPNGIVDAKTMCWPAYDEIEEVIQNIEVGDHYYYYQIQHYLLLTGFKVGYIAILFLDKRDFRIIKIERDEDCIKAMLIEYKKFWASVEAEEWNGIIDGSQSTTDTIKALNKTVDDSKENLVKSIEVSKNIWEQIVQRKEHIKELDENKRQLENIIRNEMGDYTYGVLPDGTKISLKETHRKGYTKSVKETTYRTLRKIK